MRKKKKIRIDSTEYDKMREKFGFNTLTHHKQGRFSRSKWRYPLFIRKTDTMVETIYNWSVSYPDVLFIGRNTDIGAYTYIQAQYGVIIGKNVQIGAHCAIYSHDSERRLCGEVLIEDDVLIGAHCIIFPKTIIRKGTKIRAKSILDGGEYK